MEQTLEALSSSASSGGAVYPVDLYGCAARSIGLMRLLADDDQDATADLDKVIDEVRTLCGRRGCAALGESCALLLRAYAEDLAAMESERYGPGTGSAEQWVITLFQDARCAPEVMARLARGVQVCGGRLPVDAQIMGDLFGDSPDAGALVAQVARAAACGLRRVAAAGDVDTDTLLDCDEERLLSLG